MPITVQFLLGVLGILLAPGPTNTLLAASGALTGLRGSLRLLPFTLVGYVSGILLWHEVLRPLVALYPSGPLLSKLLACAYLITTVIRMYNADPARCETAVSPARMFTVTLLNPKAAVFALLVFDQTRLNVSEFIVFSLLVPSLALLWIVLGRTFVSAGIIKSPLAISRIAAAILVVFVGLLINSIIGEL